MCHYPSRSRRQKRDAVRRATSDDLDDPLDGHANSIVPTVADQSQGLPTTTSASNDLVFEDLQWSLDDMTAFENYMIPTPQSAFPLVTSSSPGTASPTTITPPSLLLDSTDPISDEQNELTSQRKRQHQTQRQQLLSFAISPGPSMNVRSMIQRPKMHHGAERAASLILYTLKSYPLMLQQNSLPPFIHPSYVSFTDEGTTTEPLENCIALMHMMANRVKGSRKLFWRNVRTECERICDQNQTLSRWELLGAMQALSIYILIRIDEGETEHNNLDYLLERAVIVSPLHRYAQGMSDDVRSSSSRYNSLATILIVIRMTYHVAAIRLIAGKTGFTKNPGEGTLIIPTSVPDSLTNTHDRLAIIYRILNKLVFFDPAAMCDMPTEFMIAPLPAKRQLWEAKDAEDWRKQQQNQPREETSFALAVDGEIVKLDQRRLSCRDAWLPYVPLDDEVTFQVNTSRASRSAACWAEWCSGMDSMGGLIMLTASMA